MTESLTDTVIPENDPTDEVARRGRDRARLKNVGFQHGGVMIAALVIWGSAAQWLGMASEWLVQLIGVGAGFFVGVIVGFLAHEWGHFSGARLSGALSPVLKERTSFFMFNFKTASNSRAQFLAMSFGGPTANWALVALVLFALPSGTLAHAALAATVLGVAVNVCVFEFPVISRVSYGQDPAATLANRQVEMKQAGLMRQAGLLTGVLAFIGLALT